MNIKENLKLAIESSDWNSVCKIYQSMFGESIDAPAINEAPPNKQLLERIREGLSDLQAIVGLDYSEQEYDSFVVIDDDKVDEDEEENEDLDIVSSEDGGPLSPSSSSSWEKDVKVKFISSSEFELPEDGMSNYSEALSSHGQRKKFSRDAYAPNMMKCAQCGSDFDYNKEYPAGMLDSSRGIKCNKCRLKA